MIASCRRFWLRDVKSELRLTGLVALSLDPIVTTMGDAKREVKNEVRDEN